jgi:hypothetical protein
MYEEMRKYYVGWDVKKVPFYGQCRYEKTSIKCYILSILCIHVICTYGHMFNLMPFHLSL